MLVFEVKGGGQCPACGKPLPKRKRDYSFCDGCAAQIFACETERERQIRDYACGGSLVAVVGSYTPEKSVRFIRDNPQWWSPARDCQLVEVFALPGILDTGVFRKRKRWRQTETWDFHRYQLFVEPGPMTAVLDMMERGKCSAVLLFGEGWVSFDERGFSWLEVKENRRAEILVQQDFDFMVASRKSRVRSVVKRRGPE